MPAKTKVNSLCEKNVQVNAKVNPLHSQVDICGKEKSTTNQAGMFAVKIAF